MGLTNSVSGEAPAAARYGDWMQTFTGRRFWPLDPRPGEVHLPDIAHALSQQCRYAGHCRRFYSVAEHCVLMARALSGHGDQVRLWALLHDAGEAYLVDLPRPVKRSMPAYKTAETAVMLAICARYGLAPEMPEAVHDADERILHDELAQAMAEPPQPWPAQRLAPLGVTLQFWTPVEAELAFASTFTLLTGGRFDAWDSFAQAPGRAGQTAHG